MLEEKEILISIDELISRAKKLGVDFGNGNPRHRLRYYTKIGLIPHAKRKCFNNNLPQGAYPETVLNLLIEIDKKIKEGKSIQAIKKEIEKEKETERETSDFTFKPFFSTEFYKQISDDFFEKKDNSGLIEEIEKKEKIKKIEDISLLKKTKLNFIFILILIFLFFSFTFLSFQTKGNFKKISSYFTAALTNFKKITQNESSFFLPLAKEKIRENIAESDIESYYEPYLTINAEMAINGPLKVKEEITAPIFNLLKDDFLASFTVERLTGNRNYIFPDQSGTVCLSTGNCIGLAGEIFSQGAIANRITKFLSANRITSSSINDLYNLGIAMTIDASGRVGIGTNNPRANLEVVGDFITPNLFVTGQANGRVGIKTTNPQYDLHVMGRIQASGDICTDLKGGKCLSNLTEGGNVYISGGGISGSGSSGYLSLWTGTRILGDSIVSQLGDTLNVAGNLDLTKNLNVAGNINVSGTTTMAGFILSTGAQEGYILTSDASGVGRWLPAPTGTIPEGQLGYTLRHNGTLWVADDFLYNSGSLIGIGTTTPSATLSVAGSFLVTGTTTFNGISYTWPSSPGANGYVLTTDGSGILSWTAAGGVSGTGTQYYIPRWSGSMSLENSIIYDNGSFVGINTTSDLGKLTVAGSGYFLGPLTLATSTIPQMVLKYNDDNYLNFSIDTNQSTILASKKMVLNSLTGEIALANSVGYFNAPSTTISARTFLSAVNDATVRKSGELILRSSVPIFKFSVPAQTTSSVPVAVTRQIVPSILNNALPSTLPGTTRYFAFLLNFADNIPTNASSTWTIDLESGSDTEFTFAGQAMTELEEGTAHMSSLFLPPSENWQLKVSVPSGRTIRIFNIFLLVFDRVD